MLARAITGQRFSWQADINMHYYYREIMHFLGHMSPQGWLMVMAAMIVVAVFCMRGFGSRTRY